MINLTSSSLPFSFLKNICSFEKLLIISTRLTLRHFTGYPKEFFPGHIIHQSTDKIDTAPSCYCDFRHSITSKVYNKYSKWPLLIIFNCIANAHLFINHINWPVNHNFFLLKDKPVPN